MRTIRSDGFSLFCFRSCRGCHRLVVVLILAGGLLEFLDGLAQPLGQFRKLLGSEQKKNDGEDEKDLHASEAERTEYER